MRRNGPEGSPGINLDKDVELVAWAKALNLFPVVFDSQQMHEEAAVLANKINALDQHMLMGRVDKRAEEIKEQLINNGEIPTTFQGSLALLDKQIMPDVSRQTSDKTKSKTKRKNAVITSLPKQIYLEDAHPGGYDGFWGKPANNHTPLETDPEAGINAMHYKKLLYSKHIIVKDIEYQRREFLKSIGYTEKEIKARLEFDYGEAVLRLEEAGLWHLIEKGRPLLMDDILLIRSIIKIDPYRDV